MMDMMELEDVNTSSRWVKLLSYVWKIFTCLFLHLLLIAIVIGYCFFGMFMFQNLESQYEKDTKKNITYIRQNISNHIWNYTYNQKYLHKENWTDGVRTSLKDFERQLVWSMRKGGWNGNDSEDSLLWTKDGALFYSIIVITTIGLLMRWVITKPIVCSLPYDQKLVLCKKMAKTLYFGLTFDLPGPTPELKCAYSDISFKHCELENCETISVEMYPCPLMRYPDLETGEFNLLPITTFISGTHTEDTFFYYEYLPGDNLWSVYLKKLAYHVMFDQLNHLVDDQLKAEQQADEERKKSMKFEVLESKIETRFTKAMHTKNLRKTYVKFVRTFSSPPVCGLSRKYKIHFCRMLAKNDPNKPSDVFHSGYDEIRCSRRKVFFEKLTKSYLNKGYWVTMLKCPPFYEGSSGERPQFRMATRFLSTSFMEDSVFSYVRRNTRGQKIKPHSFVREINLNDFKQDRRRREEFMKPRNLPENESDVSERMLEATSLLSKFSLQFSSMEITFSRNIVEDEVISLAKVVLENKPYERFRRTIFNTNISSWTRADVEYLCRQVLLHKSYDLKMTKHTYRPGENCCPSQRIHVTLAMRDAEWLPRQEMLASQCAPVLANAFQYFVTGGMRRNSVILYARSSSNTFAIPDSFVIRVNEIFEEGYVELGRDVAAVVLKEERRRKKVSFK